MPQWRMFGGTPIGAFGSQGSDEGQLTSPREVALSADGTQVYVVDKGNHRVLVCCALHAPPITPPHPTPPHGRLVVPWLRTHCAEGL
jgi:hypothetical protein